MTAFKGRKQFVFTLEARVAADGIETGVGLKIPLWLFGFCIRIAMHNF